MKLVIGGGCRCGKTTLADVLGELHGLPVYHADELADLDWSAASDAFADVIAYGRDGIYEGVATIRALRKLLRRTPPGRVPPCTSYLHLRLPFVALTPAQRAMNAAVDSIWRDVEPRLRARGVGMYEWPRHGSKLSALLHHR